MDDGLIAKKEKKTRCFYFGNEMTMIVQTPK